MKNVIPIWWSIFIQDYLKNGQNGKQAYLTAKSHVTPRTAEVESEKLLRKPEFLEFLHSERQRIQEKLDMTRDRWMRTLIDIAEFDITKFLEKDPRTGELKLIQDWNRNAEGHVLEHITLQTARRKSGEIQHFSIKAQSKLRALEMIGKALGYLDNQQNEKICGVINFISPYEDQPAIANGR